MIVFLLNSYQISHHMIRCRLIRTKRYIIVFKHFIELKKTK